MRPFSAISGLRGLKLGQSLFLISFFCNREQSLLAYAYGTEISRAQLEFYQDFDLY